MNICPKKAVAEGSFCLNYRPAYPVSHKYSTILLAS
jgi:hypothetical protein